MHVCACACVCVFVCVHVSLGDKHIQTRPSGRNILTIWVFATIPVSYLGVDPDKGCVHFRLCFKIQAIVLSYRVGQRWENAREAFKPIIKSCRKRQKLHQTLNTFISNISIRNNIRFLLGTATNIYTPLPVSHVFRARSGLPRISHCELHYHVFTLKGWDWINACAYMYIVHCMCMWTHIMQYTLCYRFLTAFRWKILMLALVILGKVKTCAHVYL